ncbi:hypothetical protein [Streptomyces sp. NPDC088760]|uniref:hypothetical protein n=1 Tax=Streptomyces sp. NPDC088760 TaxID=3365890 RepID=UPI003817E5D5
MTCAAPVPRGPSGGSLGLVVQVRYEGAHRRPLLGPHGAGEGLADGAGEPDGGRAEAVRGRRPARWRQAIWWNQLRMMRALAAVTAALRFTRAAA